MPIFSIKEALLFGWRKTREHSGLLFQLMLTLFAVQVAHSVVMKVFSGMEEFAVSVVLLIVGVIIGTGFTRITLALASSAPATYADIWPPMALVWKFFLASLLSGLICVLGFIALIIPGVYFTLRFSMVRFAVLDGAGVRESLRRSGELTRDMKWHLLGFFLVLIALNILGAIALLVGLLITIPVSALAYAHVYLKLKEHAAAHAAPAAN